MKNNIKSSRIIRLQDVFSVYVRQIIFYGLIILCIIIVDIILKYVWNIDYIPSENLMES